MARSIAALTMLRNDDVFLPRWLAYYGDRLGHENLFVLLDGHDQSLDGLHGTAPRNVVALPHRSLSRAKGDRHRSRILSAFARMLFHSYDIVIATDVDEFLVADPATGQDLGGYLAGLRARTSVSGLGIDVVQNTESEAPIDPLRPFLAQRRHGILSARYTKPNTAFRPLTWGSGLHRVKGHGFTIDPNLFLFHFGMVDAGRTRDERTEELVRDGWSGHLARRDRLLDIVRTAPAQDGDQAFTSARQRMRKRRPIYALNKPGTLPADSVILIPERFRSEV